MATWILENQCVKAYYCISFSRMNYLAHAFLSFNQPDILAGNILSDFIKGKKKFDYSPGVQRGWNTFSINSMNPFTGKGFSSYDE